MAEREVKILVAIDKTGDYDAIGFSQDGSDATFDELSTEVRNMSRDCDLARRNFWVTAKVPIPEETEIQASKVEAVE